MKGNWYIVEENFNPQQKHVHETLFTIGNGYLGTRGSLEEGYPGQQSATFVQGVFDDAPVVHTELVNFPDWTSLEIILAGEQFELTRGELIFFKRSLNMRKGLLSRRVRWRSPAGKTVEFLFERFASMADPHLLLLQLSVKPLDFSGEIEVRAGLNTCAENLGLLHWEWLGQAVESRSAWLHLSTRSTRIEAGLAARMSARGGKNLHQEGWDVRGHPTLVLKCRVESGDTVVIEKAVSVITSLQTDHPHMAAWERIRDLEIPSWETCLKAHKDAWSKKWQKCDVIIEGDDEAQRALRFNLYHLLIAAPRNDKRVSIGAKTLSGFGYRGHVFWDTEIFMLPFFIYTQPEVARDLLSYRCHTLDGARRKAQTNGYRGAQFAWESAATGDEVTPIWLPDLNNPYTLVRIWTGDIEIHLSADIAFALWNYWQATGDDAFILSCGLEVVLETARFWASRAEWKEINKRYEFNNVIGPDEYHDHVNNNAYTNYMARWNLRIASDMLQWVSSNHPEKAAEIMAKLRINHREVEQWQKIADQIYLPFDPQSGLIEQFEGYFQLKPVDLLQYAGRKESMQAILGISGVNETQVIKQPDVLMLLCLFPDLFDQRILEANYDYYTSRTDHTHGSSLGPAIQTIMACRAGNIAEAYEHFTRAARVDLENLRGNSEHGIHGASAGGLWQAVVFGFAGLKVRAGKWEVHPALPDHWQRLAFRFHWQGNQQTIDIRRHGSGYEVQMS